MLHKKNRAGFCHHSHPLLVAIMMIGLSIVVLLHVVQRLRVGVRNDFSIQEMIGTAVIGIGTALLGVVFFILAWFVLFWIIASLVITLDFIHRHRHRKTSQSMADMTDSDNSENESGTK